MFSYFPVIALVAALALGGGVGYTVGSAKSDRVILQLQREHIEAMEEQKERSALVVKDLNDKRIELTNLRNKLDEEARNDPDAGKPSLPARSVQRLNQIK